MKNTSIKIALFTDTYDQINGVANTFRYLTRYCSENNLHLDVYTHSKDTDSCENIGSVNIYRYKPSLPIEIYPESIFDLKLPRLRLFKQFKSGNYDLIHTATPGSMGINALIAAKKYHVPMIGSYHTTLPEYVHDKINDIVAKMKLPSEHSGDRSESLMWKFMRWYYNQMQMVLAPSQFTKIQLEEKLDVPVEIFSRGIETERFDPNLRIEHDEVRVIYVGRVSIEKSLDTLAEIFQDKTDAQLIIVGDGPYMPDMQKLCGNGQFKGFLKGEELAREYASADIFAFPSTVDTFGNVVLEAMASGLPVVVTDKMGPKEIVQDSQTGFICTDKKHFAQKLQELIDDKALRRQMGKNARQYALTSSWAAVFATLFDQYQRSIEG
ncbi:MAG: glycosyltransferase family 1 protein [Phycisphaerae bacterium]|nr:glycosyltransferase family 1 protein [Phycisphaerae bacterium]